MIDHVDIVARSTTESEFLQRRTATIETLPGDDRWGFISFRGGPRSRVVRLDQPIPFPALGIVLPRKIARGAAA